jgi:Metallo-peptidase family M12
LYTRIIATLAALGFWLSLSGNIFAASLWTDVTESQVAARGLRFVESGIGRTMALNYPAMIELLKNAPQERDVVAPDSPFEMELPLPEGGFARFRVVESSIMEPQLAKRYPMLKTYVGQGIDNPTATIRFDITSRGFRAQVIASTHTSYIEPFQREDVAHYVVFNKKDYRKQSEPFYCGVTGEEFRSVPNILRRNLATNLSSGTNLRTYRLALAATAEYTAALGGTKLDGLSGMITTMNRVNGIYERELSVRMVLVGNNDLLIYTDAATDPYSNGDGGAMLGENQGNVDAVIGNSNYDIGHVFSTGGGGVAGLGVVCSSSQKAAGVTGSTNPTADAYDVDYVAHEMGHQFSGNHTFNGSGGNCSGGNRNGATAYEPGSGITIQAYAGICGADNTQPNSEDYFHRVSLNEMLGFTTNAASGASCGSSTATGNTPPTVTTAAAFTIPQLTPFTLKATGSDANGDTLTYVWEQFDLGTANTAGSLSDNGGPLFRSFIPTTDPTRTFPSLRYILNNANVAPATLPLPGTSSPNWMTAELLPSTNRVMNFRVTARDNRAGGGGTNDASTAITVTTTAGPFTVTAPNTAVTWAAGSSQTITWSVAGTNAAPVNAANVEIALSLDGGYTFPIILAASTPNDGTQAVTIPIGTPPTTQARIRVAAVGNIFFDISDVNFTITGTNTAPTLTVTGAVTTRQGSPAATAVVATVSDTQDSAGSLSVAVSQVPPELLVTVANVGGNVSITATASCSLVAPTSGNKAYPVLLTVTDSAGASTTLPVNVLVGANQIPSLGDYGNVFVVVGSSTNVSPSAAIADTNNNLIAASVSPTQLPGSGPGTLLSIASNGTITINTDGNTTVGTQTVRARANDSCGAVRERTFTVTVAPTTPLFVVSSASPVGDNNRLDPNDCNALTVRLINNGGGAATAVSAVLASTTPGVTVIQASSAYPDIGSAANGDNVTAFQVSTNNTLAQGSIANFTLTVSFAGGGTSPQVLNFSLPVGALGNYAFAAGTGATIPAGGTLIAGSNVDDGIFSVTTPAGLNFSVYNTQVPGGSTLRVTTNGTVQVVASGGSRAYANSGLPNAGTTGDFPGDAFPASLPVLFVNWDDLTLQPTGGGIYVNTVGIAPNRQYIIEWRGRTFNDGATTIVNHFAVVFNEGSNAFEYRYVQTGVGASTNGATATVGVQAATTGALFTQYSFNQGVLTAGLILSASIPPPTTGTGLCVGSALLNIDDSDAPDVYSAGTDGVLLLRYLFGLRGSALTQGATGTNARRDASQIEAHIATHLAQFDIDLDGATRASTDGLLILRRLLGLSLGPLTSGARNSNRSDTDIANAIDALKP